MFLDFLYTYLSWTVHTVGSHKKNYLPGVMLAVWPSSHPKFLSIYYSAMPDGSFQSLKKCGGIAKRYTKKIR